MPVDLFQKFLIIIDTLNKYNVHYIVIGGVAMISHGLPRLTRDLDLVLQMTAQNITRLRQALKSLYNDPAIEEITMDELQKYAVLRYGTPDNFYLDLMARVGEEADYSTLQAEDRKIETTRVRLATPQALLRLKQNTLRPEDKRDALFLTKL